MLDAETMKPIEGVSKKDCQPVTGDHLDYPVNFGKRRGNCIILTPIPTLASNLRQISTQNYKLCTNLMQICVLKYLIKNEGLSDSFDRNLNHSEIPNS